jgi:hypothetical protein
VQTTKLILLAVPILLSGCVVAPVVLTGLGVGSVAVSETTGKSITDHTVSAVNGGKDCKVSRMFKDETVCQEEFAIKLKITTTGITPSTVEEIESKYK